MYIITQSIGDIKVFINNFFDTTAKPFAEYLDKYKEASQDSLNNKGLKIDRIGQEFFNELALDNFNSKTTSGFSDLKKFAIPFVLQERIEKIYQATNNDELKGEYVDGSVINRVNIDFLKKTFLDSMLFNIDINIKYGSAEDTLKFVGDFIDTLNDPTSNFNIAVQMIFNKKRNEFSNFNNSVLNMLATAISSNDMETLNKASALIVMIANSSIIGDASKLLLIESFMNADSKTISNILQEAISGIMKNLSIITAKTGNKESDRAAELQGGRMGYDMYMFMKNLDIYKNSFLSETSLRLNLDFVPGMEDLKIFEKIAIESNYSPALFNKYYENRLQAKDQEEATKIAKDYLAKAFYYNKQTTNPKVEASFDITQVEASSFLRDIVSSDSSSEYISKGINVFNQFKIETLSQIDKLTNFPIDRDVMFGIIFNSLSRFGLKDREKINSIVDEIVEIAERNNRRIFDGQILETIRNSFNITGNEFAINDMLIKLAFSLNDYIGGNDGSHKFEFDTPFLQSLFKAKPILSPQLEAIEEILGNKNILNFIDKLPSNIKQSIIDLLISDGGKKLNFPNKIGIISTLVKHKDISLTEQQRVSVSTIFSEFLSSELSTLEDERLEVDRLTKSEWGLNLEKDKKIYDDILMSVEEKKQSGQASKKFWSFQIDKAKDFGEYMLKRIDFDGDYIKTLFNISYSMIVLPDDIFIETFKKIINSDNKQNSKILISSILGAEINGEFFPGLYYSGNKMGHIEISEKHERKIKSKQFLELIEGLQGEVFKNFVEIFRYSKFLIQNDGIEEVIKALLKNKESSQTVLEVINYWITMGTYSDNFVSFLFDSTKFQDFVSNMNFELISNMENGQRILKLLLDKSDINGKIHIINQAIKVLKKEKKIILFDESFLQSLISNGKFEDYLNSLDSKSFDSDNAQKFILKLKETLVALGKNQEEQNKYLRIVLMKFIDSIKIGETSLNIKQETLDIFAKTADIDNIIRKKLTGNKLLNKEILGQNINTDISVNKTFLESLRTSNSYKYDINILDDKEIKKIFSETASELLLKNLKNNNIDIFEYLKKRIIKKPSIFRRSILGKLPNNIKKLFIENTRSISNNEDQTRSSWKNNNEPALVVSRRLTIPEKLIRTRDNGKDISNLFKKVKSLEAVGESIKLIDGLKNDLESLQLISRYAPMDKTSIDKITAIHKNEEGVNFTLLANLVENPNLYKNRELLQYTADKLKVISNPSIKSNVLDLIERRVGTRLNGGSRTV